MYAYLYIHTCMCMPVYIYIYVRVCDNNGDIYHELSFLDTFVCLFIHTYMYVYAYLYIHICMLTTIGVLITNFDS